MHGGGEAWLHIIPSLLMSHVECPQGILLVKELIDVYGMEVVQAYMKHIQVLLRLGGVRFLMCVTGPAPIPRVF